MHSVILLRLFASFALPARQGNDGHEYPKQGKTEPLMSQPVSKSWRQIKKIGKSGAPQ